MVKILIMALGSVLLGVCVWVGCHRPQMHVQYDVMGSNQADRDAVRQLYRWSHINHHHHRPVSRSLPSLNCSYWLPKHWLICLNLLMLSPQLQTHTLTLDVGVYWRSRWDIQESLFSYNLFKNLIQQYWEPLVPTCWIWVRVCGSYFCKPTELQTQNTTAAVLLAELNLSNMIWAPVICTDPSISSRGLSAIIQSS